MLTIEKINAIRQLLDKTIGKVQIDAPKIYKKELVELLFEQPYSKIEFVVNQLKIERKAASRYLKELEKIGVLESQKAGRETLYINKDLIEILNEMIYNPLKQRIGLTWDYPSATNQTIYR